MVVIAEGTRKLLGNLFELEDLGANDLKGIAGPVHTWAVPRASSVESRFEAPARISQTYLGTLANFICEQDTLSRQESPKPFQFRPARGTGIEDYPTGRAPRYTSISARPE